MVSSEYCIGSGDGVDLTDIGLPGGLTGLQVAKPARALRLSLKALFITGYTDEVDAAAKSVVPGVEIMTKPFQVDAPIERVTGMLRGPDGT